MAIVCLFPFGLFVAKCVFPYLGLLSFSFEKRKDFLSIYFLGPFSISPVPLRLPRPPGPLPHITPARKLKNACPVQPDDIPCPCVRIAPASTKDPRNPAETRFGVNRIGGVGGRGREGRKEMDRVYLQDK